MKSRREPPCADCADMGKTSCAKHGDRKKLTRGAIRRRQLARPTRVGSRFRDPDNGRFA